MPRGVVAENGSTPWYQSDVKPPLPLDCRCVMEADRETIHKHGCRPHHERAHTYNEKAALSNLVLDRQQEHANAIEAACGTPEVRMALEALLEDFGHDMTDSELARMLDVLTDPVVYANTKARERGRFQGRRAAEQSIAHRLGLGPLAGDD